MRIHISYMVWGTMHHTPCLDIKSSLIEEPDGVMVPTDQEINFMTTASVPEICLEEDSREETPCGITVNNEMIVHVSVIDEKYLFINSRTGSTLASVQSDEFEIGTLKLEV